MTHLVNRLVFDLLCPTEEQAFGLRQQVSSLVLQDQVQEMIDRVCSRYAGEETWITIDQLEIDLGVFSVPSFSASFASSFLNGFEKELTAKLAKAATGNLQHSRQHAGVELLHYILLYGTLPWWGTAVEPVLDTLCQEAIRHNPERFTRFLLQQRFNRTVWQRIGYQLTADSRAQIIGLLPVLAAAREYLQQWIREIYAASFPDQLPGAEAVQSIVQKIILENAPRLLQHPEALSATGAITGRVEGVSGALLSWLKPLLVAGKASAIDYTTMETELPAFPANDNAVVDEWPEKHRIKTGGIVLLAPYFKPFFTELGLLNGEGWVNKAAAYRAVHLLKFLSTGLQNQPEYGLVLEKICCSLSPAEPVPLEMPLEEKEIQEAEQLLAAVIAHWSALKNTSIQGLRESFLKRDAILTRRDNGWLLQVERKTPDILLDSIPWSYSAVRLPWNDYIIMVEW